MKWTIPLALVLLLAISLAQHLSADVSGNLWFFPNETKDLTLTLKNIDYGTFNATAYLKSINTSLFLVNGDKMIRIEIYNWGNGESHSIPFNITMLDNASLGAKDELAIRIYDERYTEPVYEKSWYVRVVYPTDFSYKAEFSPTNESSIDLKLIFPDGRDSSSMDENMTKELFKSRALVTSSSGIIAQNTSSGLSLKLNVSKYIGKYHLILQANSTDNRYSIEKEKDIYLLYQLGFENVTATWLGYVNAYYPLGNESLKGGTTICVEGNILYHKTFPLGYFSEDYNLSLEVKDSSVLQSYDLENHDGHFLKCFQAPSETGNYKIHLYASGLNDLEASYDIPFTVNNTVEYKPENPEQILKKIRVSQEGNVLEINNDNLFDISGKLSLEEPGEFKHFNLSNFPIDIKMISRNVTRIPISLETFKEYAPGNYPLEGTIDTYLGKVNFTFNYQIPSDMPKGKVSYKRYFEKSENKTRITIFVYNGYGKEVKGRITETIPKDVVKSLDFLEPSNETKASARLCSQQNDTLQCLKDLAVSTKECGICQTSDCWEACVDAYLKNPGNKTYPVIFLEKPDIVESDPVVAWNLDIPAESGEKMVYIINKKVDESKFPSLSGNFRLVTPENRTEKQSNQTSNESNLIVYERKGGTNWIIVVIIVVILALGGLAFYFIKMKKRGRKRGEKTGEEEKVEEKEGEVGKEKVGEKREGKEKEGKKEPSPEEGLEQIGSGFF